MLCTRHDCPVIAQAPTARTAHNVRGSGYIERLALDSRIGLLRPRTARLTELDREIRIDVVIGAGRE